MLKAGALVRPLLTRTTCLTTPSFSFRRCPVGSLQSRAAISRWKPSSVVRCFSEDGMREVSPPLEAAFKARDKIPEDFQIIYRVAYVNFVKVTYMTAFIAIVTVPVLLVAIYLNSGTFSFPVVLSGIPLFESEKDLYLLLLMLMITILNISTTVSRYPFRIYRNPLLNKYIAILQHPIPGLVRQVKFNAGEVVPTKSWLWTNSLFKIGKKKVILLPEQFITPIELERMQIDPNKNDPISIRKRRSRMM